MNYDLVLTKINQLQEEIKKAEEEFIRSIDENRPPSESKLITEKIKEMHKELHHLQPYSNKHRGYNGL